MLRLKPFDLQVPATLDEALALLRSGSGGATMLVSGGTDLVPKLKRHQFTPDVVVSLSALEGLDEIVIGDDRVTIGGLATVRALERAALPAGMAALQLAAESVATPIIRNHATVAGNLLQDTRCRYYDRGSFWREGIGYCMKLNADVCRVATSAERCFATLCSDLAPALIALGAEVTLVGGSTRTLPLADLYDNDDGMANLKMNNEVLTRIDVPVSGCVSTYKKLRIRDSFDFPEAGVALAVEQNGDSIHARVAVTAVSAGIVSYDERLTVDGVDAFVERVYAEVKPMDTLFFPPAYRKRVVRNFLAKSFDELLSPQ